MLNELIFLAFPLEEVLEMIAEWFVSLVFGDSLDEEEEEEEGDEDWDTRVDDDDLGDSFCCCVA